MGQGLIGANMNPKGRICEPIGEQLNEGRKS